MNTKLLIPVAILAVAAPAAFAATGNDRLVRHRISYVERDVPRKGFESGARLSFYVPAGWERRKSRDAKHVSFRTGSASCRYSVTFTTRQAAFTDESPAARAVALAPAPNRRYVLDEGTRGSGSAWRVARLAPTAARPEVRVRAVRIDRRSLGSGGRAWQESIVSAVSARGSECHSGSYRQALGPRIGDALATSQGRIFSFKRR